MGDTGPRRHPRSGRARAAIIGCGYVGLTLAVESARAGSPVTGIDVNEALVKELRAGSNPVPDVYIPDGELAQLRDAGRLQFADVHGRAVRRLRDLRPHAAARGVARPALRRVGRRVGRRASCSAARSSSSSRRPTPGRPKSSCVRSSRKPRGWSPGSTSRSRTRPSASTPATAKWGLHNTPKVVGGLEPWCTELACAFYDRVAHSVVPVSSPRAAEITKLFENSHRLVNIALANEMAIVCHDFDIDPWEVLQAAVVQAVRVHAVPSGPRRRGRVHPGRPAVPRVARAREARPAVPACSRPRATSTTACRRTSRSARPRS